MGKVPMVTKTIKSTIATVLTVNIIDNQTMVLDVVVPRTYPTEEKLLKAVREKIETDEEKVVAIKEYHVTHNVYTMTEDVFILHALKMEQETENEIEGE